MCGRFFYLKNLELIQWITLIPEISKFWSDSLGVRFWNFPSFFENVWVAPKCVGVTFSKSPKILILLRWSFSYIKWGVLIWFHLNPRNFNPRNFQFSVGFSFETLFPLPPSVTTFISKDVEFYCASFDIYEKFAGACPPTQTPTQKLKSWFSMSSSQGIASSLISFEMIFRVLQSELFRFKFKSLSSKIVKIPEFNLRIPYCIAML